MVISACDRLSISRAAALECQKLVTLGHRAAIHFGAVIYDGFVHLEAWRGDKSTRNGGASFFATVSLESACRSGRGEPRPSPSRSAYLRNRNSSTAQQCVPRLSSRETSWFLQLLVTIAPLVCSTPFHAGFTNFSCRWGRILLHLAPGRPIGILAAEPVVAPGLHRVFRCRSIFRHRTCVRVELGTGTRTR
jgi:hypothetical protein